MLDQPVHLLDRGPGPGSDPLAARGVEKAHRNTFLVGHRQNDGFLPTDHRIVDSGSGDLLLHLAEARQHAHDSAKTAHLLKLAKLAEEVVHVELAPGHPFGQPLGLFDLDRLGRLFDKRDNVAHIQDAAGHPRRIELLQRVLLFADTDKLDRAAGDLAHRQSRAATRVTVETGQHDAGDIDSLLEGRRRGHSVLAGHRVGDKQNLMRVGQRLDLAKLGHQTFIDRHPAGSVENQHVEALKLCRLKRPFGNLCGGFAVRLGQHANLGLLAKDAKLLARRRARHVKRGQHDLLSLARAQTQRQLAGGGGLARALKTGHQDHRRRIRGDIQRRRFAAQHLDQRVIDDLDDLLVGPHRLQDVAADGLFAHSGDEGFHDRQGDIGIQKRKPDLAQRGIDIRFAQRTALAKGAENVLQLVLQTVKHGACPVAVDPAAAGDRPLPCPSRHTASACGIRARKLQGRMEPARVWQPAMA